MMKTHLYQASAVAALALALTACDKKNDSISETAKADKAASIDGRPFHRGSEGHRGVGLHLWSPLVMNYTANYEFWVGTTSKQYKCPFNQLKNEHRVFTYEDTAVVTPNSDRPYSLTGLDLLAEPFVVSVPAVEKERYYSLQFVDWNTFNFGYVGSRATGTEQGDYLVAGPDWKGETPAGIKGVLHSTTQFTVIIIRIQLFGPDDMANVEKVQAGYKVQPLSAFLNQPASPAAPKLDFPKANAELAKISIGPDKTFNFRDLSLEHKAAVLLGMKEGEKKVEERAATRRTT